MAIRETMQDGVTLAFATVDNLKESITIREQTGGGYTAATGVVARTTSDHILNAVLARVKRLDLENPAVRATDLVALWDPQDDLTFEPQVGMSVDRSGDEYDIVWVDPVGPADGGPALLWKMMLRRPSTEAA
jgi:predicted metalloprotease with PDZ domain